MIHIDPAGTELKLRKENTRTQVFDPVRKKWVVLTPEEHVRQCLLHFFIHTMQYPVALISVEKKLRVGAMDKRFDIVVYNRDHNPWLLAECKAPDIAISERSLYQLLQYQQTLQCHYWLVSNGHQSYCADACDVNNIKWLGALPAYDAGI